MAKLSNQMTPEEFASTLASAMAVVLTLTNALKALDARKIAFPNEAASLNPQMLQLERELAKLQSQMQAFIAAETAMSPPSPDQLKQLSSLSAALDSLIKGATTTDGILALTTAVLTTWNSPQV